MSKTIWLLKGLSGTREEYVKTFWFQKPSILMLVNAGVGEDVACFLLGLTDYSLSTNWSLQETKEGEII